ncbi:hypothetical protein LTR05_006852 [Lithohypha guttulata]|uniref:Nephrocystin 3-like N-terminal domain-containing protein n=1 Tax=Lithohypha guttulata TaxID=1690604 RepID=A0AAN7SWM4_9EURO|nr:hypothetical protein LTR05_006852 [Lithohypha guttulata]
MSHSLLEQQEAVDNIAEPAADSTSNQSSGPVQGHHFPAVNAFGNAHVHLGDRHFHHYAATNSHQANGTASSIADKLFFPEILQRYETIEERYGDTLDWIFDPPEDEQPPWDSFVDWLSDGDSIYWVSGKPGSGKSTLMKYLVKKVQGSNFFGNKALIVLSCWFWEAGQLLQHNETGCLRSILWQLLRDPVCQLVVSKALSSLDIDKHELTEPRLRAALRSALSAVQNMSTMIVMFLDGLDECVLEGENLLHLAQDLNEEFTCLKICISSRPEQVYKDAFAYNPKLLLQHLNASDINEYIVQEFLFHPKVEKLLQGKHVNTVDDLRWSLQDRAEGVFLWVRLAVKSLVRGIGNRDSLETLQERLEDLPSDLDNLYTVMLARAASDTKYYESQAALYFELIIHKEMTLDQFAVAINESFRERCFDGQLDWDDSVLRKELGGEDLAAWINVRTSGLLEVEGDGGPLSVESSNTKDFLHTLQQRRVTFIHRTAHTYLLDTVQGREMLSACTTSKEMISSICFRSQMVCDVLPHISEQCSMTLGHILWGFCESEKCHDPSNVLCKDFESFCNKLLRRNLLHVDIMSMWGEYDEAKGRFLRHLLSLGADMTCTFSLEHGEQFLALPYFCGVWELADDTILAQVFNQELLKINFAISALPTIQACDHYSYTLDRPKLRWTGRVGLCVWGDTTLLDPARSFIGCDHAERSIWVMQRIYILCRPTSLPKRPAELYLVSKSQSNAVFDSWNEIDGLRSVHSEFTMRIEGLIHLVNDAEFATVLDELCQQCKRAETLLEALVYMGHQPEVVYRYTELEEARLRRRPRVDDETIRRWKRWVLGPALDLKTQPFTSLNRTYGPRNAEHDLQAQERVCEVGNSNSTKDLKWSGSSISQGRARRSPLLLLKRP